MSTPRSRLLQRAARDTFLDTAARLLATTDPTTSAHMGREASALRLAAGQPKHDRDSRCGGCGSLFIPGRNCTVKRGETPSQSRAGDRVNARRPIEYHCHLCHRCSIFPFPDTAKARLSILQEPDPPAIETEAPLQVEDSKVPEPKPRPTIIVAKLSKKKRAKARKETLLLQSQIKSR